MLRVASKGKIAMILRDANCNDLFVQRGSVAGQMYAFAPFKKGIKISRGPLISGIILNEITRRYARMVKI